MISLEILINNLDEVVCLFDRKRRVAFINKAGEEFFGKSYREMRNKTFGYLFPHSDEIEMLVQNTISDGRLYNSKGTELDIGRKVNVDLHIVPFYTPDSIDGAILCIRENTSISERDDYQFDHLLFLLGSIAHEIKNPLSGIKGAAQILKANPCGAEAGTCLDLIIKEADRLNSVLLGYLTMTRLPRFHQVNVHEVIEHALRVLEPDIRSEKIVLEKSYDPSLPYISGDEGKLLQVFINLIKNAIEAMELGKDKKVLSITTRPSDEYMLIYEEPTRASNGKKMKKQRWLVINFQDTGIGLTKEEINRIFLPLYSKKDTGSGLGLSLSKKIIKDHGGLIRVKSPESRGAVFSIYLPLEATGA
jgi:two-component system, NtrC family, nitrogen regulation sensor histidine kinase GlnL